MSNSATKSDDRARNWTFIVYPESVADNWREKLDNMHLEWVESPLHDKDLNGDGNPKKPHIHVGVFYDGKKSYQQVLEVSDAINGTVPQRVHNAKSLIRYFAHLDNPEKAQYSMSDIHAHGGIDIHGLLAPSSAERYQIIHEMMEFCISHDVYEFSDLCEFAMEEHFDDWFPVLVDHNTIVMQTFLTSRRHRFKGLTDQE